MDTSPENKALGKSENGQIARRGVTLVEAVVICVIIAVICAIAIPNLIRSRIQSNEAATIGNLRTINGAETAYHRTMGVYAGTFQDLCNRPNDLPPFLDDSFAQPLPDGSVFKSGYIITLSTFADGKTYEVLAVPKSKGYSGEREFYTDTSGVIKYALNGVSIEPPNLGES